MQVIGMSYMILVISLGSIYCSEDNNTKDENVNINNKELKEPSGWKIEEPFIRKKYLIQSIYGDREVSRYWEFPFGGEVKPKYMVIESEKSLNEYWNVLINKKVLLEKPSTDFNEKKLIVVQPSDGIMKYRYFIKIIEMEKKIVFNVSNKSFGNATRILLGINPIFVFELPKDDKPVWVKFNIDSRSYGSFRK